MTADTVGLLLSLVAIVVSAAAFVVSVQDHLWTRLGDTPYPAVTGTCMSEGQLRLTLNLRGTRADEWFIRRIALREPGLAKLAKSQSSAIRYDAGTITYPHVRAGTPIDGPIELPHRPGEVVFWVLAPGGSRGEIEVTICRKSKARVSTTLGHPWEMPTAADLRDVLKVF